MTTKDYVYLALLATASLLFYCHGFYAGITRAVKAYDNIHNDELEKESTAEDTLTSPPRPHRQLLDLGGSSDSHYKNN